MMKTSVLIECNYTHAKKVMLELAFTKRHNGREVAASNSSIPAAQQRQLQSLILSQLPKRCGESMTEPENESANSRSDEQDEVAKYRLKLEETADLVARIRHEINNPLTGVLGQAQLLLREELSERSRKRVKTIEDLALRLRDVVAQLREVQRPGSEGGTNGAGGTSS
jgi:nitrogen-specific signal transduction histidine kinase